MATRTNRSVGGSVICKTESRVTVHGSRFPTYQPFQLACHAVVQPLQEVGGSASQLVRLTLASSRLLRLFEAGHRFTMPSAQRLAL